MDFTIRRTRDEVTIDHSASFVMYSTADYHPTASYTQTNDSRIPKSKWEAMKESARVTLSARRGVLGPLQDEYGFTGYDFVEGTGVPQPEDIISEFALDAKKANNSPFRQKVKAGQIVVAPYQSAVKSRVLIRSGRVTDPGTYLGTNLFPAILAGSAGFRVVGDRWYFNARVFIFPKTSFPFRVTMERAQTRWVTPSFYTAKGLYDRIKAEGFAPDVGLITDVWSKNNQLRLDFLTTMAEAPKTISSLLDGLGSLGGLIRDFKNRKIFLTKGHQRSLERYGMTYKEKRAQISARYDLLISQARTLNFAMRMQRAKAKRLKNLLKDQRKVLRKANQEYVTSIASLWLQWRYEVLPLAYTAQDALDVIADLHSQFLTSRGRLNRELAITTQGSWGLTPSMVTLPYVQRVMVKSKLSPAEFYGRTMSVNPFTTAWELLTLSFVVDWFINIGDVISAFTGGYSSTSGSTSSNLLDASGTLRSKVSPDAFVSYSIKFYSRDVIDPRLCGGLVISPDLNLQRGLDAMALAWGRSKLKIHRY